MQKKSFLIKDILQKLNEDDSAKHSPQQNGGKLEDLKKLPCIDSSRLLYDWHSLAMAAAVSQQNALISPAAKSVFTLLGRPIAPDDQSKLRAFFPFADCSLQQSMAAAAALESYQKRQLSYLMDDELVNISENSNLSLCESSSSKFSDGESQADDAKSEASSLISIEHTTDDGEAKTSGDQKNSSTRADEKAKNRRKNRRNRTVFTELQLMGLERRFDGQKYLSTPDRAELANALGLSQLQVKTWYQNRRMKWKKQVMQGGCLIAPTKPKGRPKKGTIPSLGLTFDTSSLLSTIEARKNATLMGKQSSPIDYNKELGTAKQSPQIDYGDLRNTATTANPNLNPNLSSSLNSNLNPNVNANQIAGPSLCSVSQLIAQHGTAGELGQSFFSKANAFGTKRAKLSFC